MTTKLSFGRDISDFNTFAPAFSDEVWRTTLAAGAAQSLTVPINPDSVYPNWLALISIDPGKRVFIGLNTVATVPGSSFAKLNAPLNSTPRIIEVKLTAGNFLSFITPDTDAYVTVEFYAIQ